MATTPRPLFDSPPTVRGTRLNVAVMQPLPGIGDMIWHLPHLHALATAAGGPVTLITKPRSAADQFLGADPAIRDIIWVDRNPASGHGRHDGLRGLLRLARELRARRFDAIVLLHQSVSLAVAALLAGISARAGYGYGAQRWLLNRGPVQSRKMLRQHQFHRASAWIDAAGIPLPEAEPCLVIADAARATAAARLTGVPRPFVAIGLGASEPQRQWGAPRYAALLHGLHVMGWASVVLVGGAAEAPVAAKIRSLASECDITEAIGWRLDAVAALLAEATFFIGNNTGTMNMAAAVGIPTYALFGTDRVIDHSRHIIPIVSPSGPAGVSDGVARITPEAVLAAIADRLRAAPGKSMMTGATVLCVKRRFDF